MHKENCTVSLVMSERGLNMNDVIYNSGCYGCYHTELFGTAAPLFER